MRCHRDFLFGCTLYAATPGAQELPDRQPQLPAEPKLSGQETLVPRPPEKIPDGAFGEKLRQRHHQHTGDYGQSVDGD